MKWLFEVSPDNISEYTLTSSEGHFVSFKYSRLQQSIRLKHNDQRSVYLLDKNSFAARKFFIRNVYGSEIGTVAKTFLSDIAGNVVLPDHAFRLHFRINPKDTTIDLHNEGIDATCQLSETWDKDHEEMYMLALIGLSWMYSVATPQRVQALA